VAVALYRRYRPESFEELIGQSQVTDPLRAALRNNRVNHAYLFSGPRGCGKTTSARILARCLNCAEGPTDTPCGKCASCVELSRDGSGSIDVIEIDAASHNGVDDARDLRERAGFAPSRDRYKIYILDEAHMVTQQGFNALLKIVEEPPEHVKFIFATTEPEKVIGTIRSRTHHYPFRLVAPATMLEYITQLCVDEKVEVEDGVLPLVIRAGGGSVRDTLSLLDQIIAGSENGKVSRDRTNNLLGYTPSELLDESLDAVGRGDSSTAFSVIDRVVQTGSDPRRFVEDVLERYRDLVIVDATGDGAQAVLRGIPADEVGRMRALATLYGSRALSRAADIVNDALSNMTGTTPPRIHLELMIARLLVERGAGNSPSESPAPVAVAGPSAPPAQASKPAEAAAPSVTAEPTVAMPPVAVAAPEPKAPPAVKEQPVKPATESGAEGLALSDVTEIWDDVVEDLKENPGAWVVVNAAKPVSLEGDVLQLDFTDAVFLERFKEKPSSGTAVFEDLREALIGALGIRFRFVPRVGLGIPLTGVTPAVTPTAAPAEPTNPFVAQAEADAVARADTASVEQVEPAAEPVAKQAEEQRGEAVVRDLLGATLIDTIDREVAPGARFVDADDTSESLFASPGDNATDTASAETPPSER
jgi:DNA polymerase III subunit gamma/tau